MVDGVVVGGAVVVVVSAVVGTEAVVAIVVLVVDVVVVGLTVVVVVDRVVVDRVVVVVGRLVVLVVDDGGAVVEGPAVDDDVDAVVVVGQAVPPDPPSAQGWAVVVGPAEVDGPAGSAVAVSPGGAPPAVGADVAVVEVRDRRADRLASMVASVAAWTPVSQLPGSSPTTPALPGRSWLSSSWRSTTSNPVGRGRRRSSEGRPPASNLGSMARITRNPATTHVRCRR